MRATGNPANLAALRAAAMSGRIGGNRWRFVRVDETPLTGRELDVLWLTAWGYTQLRIAARLGISDMTVNTFRVRGSKR